MCNGFLNLSPSVRGTETQKLKLSFNCLRPNHRAEECKLSKCRKCGKAHNTLLHLDYNDTEQNSVQVENIAQSSQSNTGVVSQVGSATSGNVAQALLSTAVVQIMGSNGICQDARVFLNSGARNSFVSQALCERLNLQLTKTNFSILGVGQVRTSV
ncbi:hypothetical protein JTB14_010578 [Gonioctena quinquepunctata]|nr:hypothetical protein JTB14_010578 [Gonioctena quinquepunctata]